MNRRIALVEFLSLREESSKKALSYPQHPQYHDLV